MKIMIKESDESSDDISMAAKYFMYSTASNWVNVIPTMESWATGTMQDCILDSDCRQFACGNPDAN